MRIYTIGHSTHSFDKFVAILKQYKITFLVDVRTMPRSRHTPQFNQHSLAQTLPRIEILYTHIAKLGGLRAAHKDSIHTGWRNKSFRGYADYMQTKDFAEGLQELITLAGDHAVAIMCAEAVPWRCHRSMIGDALIVRGYEVMDIFSATSEKPEQLTSFAKVDGTSIAYPPESS